MVMRDRKPPETKPQTEVIEDFSSGLNTTISPSLLNKNEAQVAEDISFEQKGTIVPRKGRRRRYDDEFSPYPTSGLGMLYKQDGTSRLIVTSDTTMYYDEPREGIKYTTKADWDKGEMNDYVSSSRVEGSLVPKLGHQNGISEMAGTATAFGEKSYTYGRKFTVDRRIIVTKIRFIPRVKDEPYTLLLWGADKELLKTITKVPTESDLNNWVEETFTATPIRLEPGVEYVVGVSLAVEKGLSKYDEVTALASPLQHMGVFSAEEATTYPETEEEDVDDIGIDIAFDVDDRVETFGIGLTIPKLPDKEIEDDVVEGELTGSARLGDDHVYLQTTQTWRALNIVNWSDIA